jgi:hypothetical protein
VVRKTWRNLVKKPEENRPLETPRHGCKDNIKTDVKATRYEGINWDNVTDGRRK